MKSNKFTSEAAEKYFHSLPSSLQESVTQSGLSYLTEQQLRACAAQILGRPQESDEAAN